MSDDFPYGRSAEGCSSTQMFNRHKSKPKHVIRGAHDNESFIRERDGYKFHVRYDAPREENKTRGHLSFWAELNDEECVKFFLLSGDDMGIFDRYVQISQERIDIYDYVSRSDIERIIPDILS